MTFEEYKDKLNREERERVINYAVEFLDYTREDAEKRYDSIPCMFDSNKKCDGCRSCDLL